MFACSHRLVLFLHRSLLTLCTPIRRRLSVSSSINLDCPCLLFHRRLSLWGYADCSHFLLNEISALFCCLILMPISLLLSLLTHLVCLFFVVGHSFATDRCLPFLFNPSQVSLWLVTSTVSFLLLCVAWVCRTLFAVVVVSNHSFRVSHF